MLKKSYGFSKNHDSNVIELGSDDIGRKKGKF